jgi:hypothetical protein
VSSALGALRDALISVALIYGLCAYGERAREASELELSVAVTALSFLMMLPLLRSRLIRRRLWVNTWMAERATLTELLQGGVIFASLTFALSVPWAVLLISELVNLSVEQRYALCGLAALSVGARALFRRVLRVSFTEVPVSLLSREWGARVYGLLGVITLIPITLYQDRIDMKGLALQEALLRSGVTDEGLGLFAFLQRSVELKEVSFWWLIENIDVLLSGAPPVLIKATRFALAGLYTLYSISIVYGFSKVMSASLELTDPVARRFFWGERALHDD